MGHPGSVADSRASSRLGSVDGLLRLSAGNGQPLVGGQPEVPQPQVAQWEVIPQGAGTALLVPASPTATAPVPPILATRADSTASPAREGTPHNRPSRDNSGTLPSEDGRSESGRTWLSRVTDRTKLLREMFELEPTEVRSYWTCSEGLTPTPFSSHAHTFLRCRSYHRSGCRGACTLTRSMACCICALVSCALPMCVPCKQPQSSACWPFPDCSSSVMRLCRSCRECPPMMTHLAAHYQSLRAQGMRSTPIAFLCE